MGLSYCVTPKKRCEHATAALKANAVRGVSEQGQPPCNPI